MLNQFAVRFVIAVFGGAAVGLLLGVLGHAVAGTPDNVFSVMPWTIMAASLGLSFAYVRDDARRKAGRD